MLVLPVAVVATGGCLATKGDIEKLQLSIRTFQDTVRLQQARSDAEYRTLVRGLGQQLAQQFAKDLGVVSDSLRQVSSAVQRLQGDVSLSMHDLRTQFTTLQEGIGQSQKRIQDLGNKVEAVTAAPPAPRVVDPASGAPAPGGSTVGAPPAAQLFDMARQNLRRGATGAARDGFDTFLKAYPEHERAGEAQMWIADAYAQEGNRAAADSVYALVVTKYSTPDVVSRSLYKRAMALKEVGQAAEASKLFQVIVDKYPRADERDLAVEMLRTLKKP